MHSPYEGNCITVIKACRQVIVCYSYSVIPRIVLVFIALPFLVYAGCPAYGANQDSANNQKAANALPATTAPASKSDVSTKTKANDTENELPQWYATVEWSNWALVVIAAITAWAIWIQAKETKKAAEDGRSSADAALLNAQAVLDSERPWLVVMPERNIATGELGFHFRVMNKGRTPARLVSATIDDTFIVRPDQLPIPPPYKTAFYAPPNRFLASGDGFNIRRTQSEANIGINPVNLLKSHRAQIDKAQPGEFLIFFGEVIYDDVLGSNGSGYKQHRTRWCFAFFEHGQTFEAVGPKEYNEYT